MFTTESEKREYALKPMNCPGHVLIFKSHLRSYRELPIRYGEFGQCHRNEPSGALHGIMRVRGFTQDDGHVFCTEDQILDECVAYTDAAAEGLPRLRLHRHHLQGRDAARQPGRRRRPLGQGRVRAAWRRCAAPAASSSIAPGDGAFYGPKIEYTLKDALGRQWQLGTMQVDFNTAERLGGDYVTETSGRAFPVMLHRAIVGSFERFIGILLEHHAGAHAGLAGAGAGERPQHLRKLGRLRPGSCQNTAKTRT